MSSTAQQGFESASTMKSSMKSLKHIFAKNPTEISRVKHLQHFFGKYVKL
jgi:hypothetical protein